MPLGKCIYTPMVHMEFSSEVASADWEDLFGRRTLDTKWSIFKDKYAYLVDKYIPHKMVKPGQRHKPPWTRYKSVKLAKQKRRKAWIKSRDSTLNVHDQLYQQASKNYKETIENAKEHYENSMVTR